jgi:DNA-binding phage protein
LKKKTHSKSAKTEKKTRFCHQDTPTQNKELVLDAILQIFKKNKIHPIMTLIETYLQSKNKSAFSKKIGISRATLYDMLSGKKNPTVRIFIHCVHEILTDSEKNAHQTHLKTKKEKSSASPEKIASSKQLILEAVVDVFKKNKVHPMIEVIRAYLKSKNKSVFAKDVGISRATLYDMLNGKKNPTLRVFMQCIDVMINKRSSPS